MSRWRYAPPRPRDASGPSWACFALAAVVLRSPEAIANGRFPAAQQVVIGPGARSDVIALRVTFGFLISRDAGRTFSWICEAALYDPMPEVERSDPSIEILANGEIAYGFEYGVQSLISDCEIRRHPSAGGGYIADLTTTPDGSRIWALESAQGSTNHALTATSGSLEFERLGRGLSGVEMLTIEVAPSNTRRLYLTGIEQATRLPKFFRSDDGGATLVTLTPDLGTSDDAFVSGVDPTNPDVLFVRTHIGVGSALFKSTDGGAHFTRIATARDPMLGFALSDDGRSVWYGSGAEGLWRSDDAGGSFAQVNTLPAYCLRFHSGALWACSDWRTQPFALGRSRDGGRSFEAVLRFQDLVAPTACTNPTPGQSACEGRWLPLQQMLTTVEEEPDAGAFDAGTRTDARTATDATPLMDVSARSDAGPSTPVASGNCGCSTRGTTPGTLGTLVALCGLAVLTRRRVSRAER